MAGSGGGADDGPPLKTLFSDSLNLDEWILRNRESMVPPVGNKLLYNGKMSVMLVAGPNERLDYHIEAGEEVFFMLERDMRLGVATGEDGVRSDVTIGEGEWFLLPSRVPHSPQRPAASLGMVIERRRAPEEKDALRWYQGDSSDVLYEEWFHCTDLGKDLVPVIERFNASESKREGRVVEPLPEAPFALRTDTAPFQAKSEAELLAGKEDGGGVQVMLDGEDFLIARITGGETKEVMVDFWDSGIMCEGNEVMFWHKRGKVEVKGGRGIWSFKEGNLIPFGAFEGMQGTWGPNAETIVIATKK